MKKTLLCLVALMMSLGVFANEYKHEFDKEQLTTAGGEVTLSDVVWTASAATYIGWDQNYGKGVQIGSSKNPTTAFTLSTSAIKGKISKITVNSAIANGGDAKLSIAVGGTKYLDGAELQLEKADYSCEPNAEGDIAISFAATAKAFYIASITVEYVSASTKKPVKVEFAGKTSYNVFIGENFPCPQAYVVDGEETLYDLPVTYTVDKPELATLEVNTDGTPIVTILAAGKFNVKASFAGNDTYEAASANCSFTAMQKFATIAELLQVEPTGQTVCVAINEATITDIYLYNEKRAGIYVNDGTETVLIYCQNPAVPEEWAVGGKVEGRLICPWKVYKETKELCPTGWDDLTYTASAGVNALTADRQGAAIYNMAGQLLKTPKKGINITAGKKVLVK